MPETLEEYRERIIKVTDERKEFVTDVDGYVYFWPTDSCGHFAPHHLRWLADELDKRNADWDKSISDYFSGASTEEPSLSSLPLESQRHFSVQGIQHDE